MPTYTTTSNLNDDPQECDACLALGEVCDFHRGFAEGWDLASALVGKLVLESGSQ